MKVLFLIAVLTVGLQQSTKTQASIEGTIIDDLTGTPLAKASVHLREHPEIIKSTDEEGRFSFTGVVAGIWHLCANKSGYLAIGIGKTRSSKPQSCVEVSVDQPQVHPIVIRAIKGAMISGTITGYDGRPATGVAVIASRYTYDDNGAWLPRDFYPLSSAQTDDRGAFTIENLLPGTYVLRAVYSRLKLGERHPALHLPVTYYPGAARPSSANTIELKSGTHVSIGTFSLLASQGARLHIRVINATGSPPAQGAKVVIRSAISTDIICSGILSRGVLETDLAELPTGLYLVQAEYAVSGPTLHGSGVIEMGQSDTSVEVVVARPARILAELAPAATNGIIAPLEKVRIQLLATNPALLAERTSVASTELLALNNLVPGDYRVKVIGSDDGTNNTSQLPPGLYVSEIRGLGRGLLPNELQVRPGDEARITIILGRNPNAVQGVVVNDRGNEPIPGAVVVLLPDDKQQKDWVRVTTADSAGKFQLTGAPTSYHMFAWSTVEGEAYRNEDFMRAVVGDGVPISLKSGGIEDIRLQVSD